MHYRQSRIGIQKTGRFSPTKAVVCFALLFAVLIVLAGNLERTTAANMAVKNATYATYNVTLSDTGHGSETVTATQWYFPDEFWRFVISLLVPTTATSVCASVAAAYAAKRDIVFAAKVGAAVFVIVVFGTLLVVVGLSQTTIPFIRRLNTPNSPELGVYSAIFGIFLAAGFLFLGTLLFHKGLRISKIELVPKQFDRETGYLVNALVENHDRRVVYDLSAQFAVSGSDLQLLRVERHEDDGRSSLKLSFEPYRKTGYAWQTNGADGLKLGHWPELRQHDKVTLVHPEESTAVSFIGNSSIHGMTSGNFLYAKGGGTYKILLEVKGVDANKSTIVAKRAISKRLV